MGVAELPFEAVIITVT